MLDSVSSMDGETAPPLSDNVRRLMDIARGEFVRSGFDGVSIDGIARTANISKETIYRLFPDKAALFHATTQALGESYGRSVSHIAALGLPAPDALFAHAMAIGQASFDGGILSGVWLAVSNARERPVLAASLRDSYTRHLEPLHRTIADALPAGCDAPFEYAEDFGSMVVRGARHIMGEPVQADAAGRPALESHARQVVRMFLHGCAPDRRPAMSRFPFMPASLLAAPPTGRPGHIRTLLNVATDHFLKRGYHHASLDQIGEEARVGRGTLYRHFGNKAGLFDAAMTDRAHAIAALARWDMASTTDALATPRACLESAAQTLGAADSIALHRAVIAEANRTPMLARRIHAITRAPWVVPLADWLSQCVRQGVLSLQDAEGHTELLVILATQGNRRLISGRSPSPAESRDAAGRACHMLLHGAGGYVRPDSRH